MEYDYENTTTDENPIEDLLVESKCKLMNDINNSVMIFTLL